MLMPKLPAAFAALIFALAPISARADNAADLGPSTTGATQGGSSSTDSSSLQPAGTSPLQSTTGDSNGLTAPNANTLQAPSTGNDTLSVISGDADGGPHNLSGSAQWWLWAGFTLLLALIVATAVWLRRQRHHRRRSQHVRAGEAEPAIAPTEPTSSQRLNVTIAKPTGVVFEYVLNPGNTHKWVQTITEEQASDLPPHIGTIYRNRDAGGHWTEYELTELTEGESFELVNHTNGYHVRYTLAAEGEDATYLEYFEFVEDGQLINPFTQAELEKLKQILETSDETPEKTHSEQP